VNHRAACTFGPGFYRVELVSGGRRFCQSEAEVRMVTGLIMQESIRRVVRDGYCLDQDDLESPHVIEGERFLALGRAEAMAELGIDSEADYARAYRAVEDAVLARDRAMAAGARDRPSIVIKKKGRTVLDAT
jgi:hypothetical protein